MAIRSWIANITWQRGSISSGWMPEIQSRGLTGGLRRIRSTLYAILIGWPTPWKPVGLDSLVITTPLNVTYMSGFNPTAPKADEPTGKILRFFPDMTYYIPSSSHTGCSSLSNSTLSGQILIFHLTDKLSTQDASVAHCSPLALGGLL